MRNQSSFLAGLVVGACIILSLGFHPGNEDKSSASTTTVVPDAEKKIAQDKNLEGPTKTSGIEGVTTLVELGLGSEFPGLDGQQMRARELVLAPGAVVAVHQHEKRPGFAYMLEGEMVEVRNDSDGPILRKVGDVAVERTGVSHYWENKSGKPARALVVDVVPVK